LGDVIDGQCSFKTNSEKELNAVLSKFDEVNVPIEKRINLIGNHELYNFSREQLKEKLLTSRKGGHDGNICKEYYHIKPCPGWRLLIIDPYQESVIGLKENDPKFIKASSILMDNNKNMNPSVFNGGGSWYDELVGFERRFVPFNGGVGEKQIEWLSAQLKEAKEQGEKCILMSHVPLHPHACDGVAMIWDYPNVVKCLHDAPRGTVVAVLCGHDHHGGYYYDENDIHHITFKSPLNLGNEGDCFGTIDVSDQSLVLKGPHLRHFLHRKLIFKNHKDERGRKSTIYYEDADECVKLLHNHNINERVNSK
jgi:manganese-dependent ADP-ribose/CDP-alcohol diphosphatase